MRMANERIEVQRTIAAEPSAIFKLLTDPQGHVAIDSSGMLQSAEEVPVGGVGDTFVVHMDREDYGYRLEPADDGTLVTSYYDWSGISQRWRDSGIFPVISEGALRATLGIVARTVRRAA
jgi:hypothetical protein